MTREDFRNLVKRKLEEDADIKKAYAEYLSSNNRQLSDRELNGIIGGYSSDDYHAGKPCPDCGRKVDRDFLGYYCDNCGWHEFWWQ